MTSDKSEGGYLRSRRGVCHRCGWKGSVTKLARRERARLDAKEFGRLCSDCVDDLVRIASAPAKASSGQIRAIRPIGHRHVA
jgi:hypothetical protein